MLFNRRDLLWLGSIVRYNINGLGHMTKMAAMVINSKNLLKSSPEAEDV